MNASVDTSERQLTTMPKIKLTEQQKNIQRIADNLKLLQNSREYNSHDMGDIIGASNVTYLKRLENPLELRLDEILRICRHFKVEPEKFVGGVLTIG